MKASNSLKPTNGGWQREGQVVKALYLGTEECIGEIVDSRVAYGGKVKHSLKLKEKLVLPWCTVGAGAFYPVSASILIDEENIVEIYE